MSNPYEGLEPAFVEALNALLKDCADSGVTMRPFFGLRDPVTQAKLWRQSRTRNVITARISSLKLAGASFLARCIEVAGPQNGPWATNAIPGYSWHQWGLACDCIWIRSGKGTFDLRLDGAANGYALYAAKSPKHGLTCLASIGDHDHVQLPKEGSPTKRGLEAINAAMETKFGANV